MSRQRFALVLEAPDKADGIRLLRHLLKAAGRRYQLKCITARELHDTDKQRELFTTPSSQPDPLHGLLAQLPKPCRCGAELATIGPGKAMHAASLICCECQKHRGWIGGVTHKSLTETVKKFGRPTEPIVLRAPNPPPAARDLQSG
jgi:hypothetical protein